jgi:hypothetical protein
MKKLFFPLFALLLAWTYSPAQKSKSSLRSTGIIIDSTDYEITIIDSQFDTWYLLHYSPVKDYSNEYYRNRNQIGVSNWNDYFDKGQYQRIIENHIFYNSSVDYGIEVNRKLYWYFKYTEEQFCIRVLQ